MLDPKRALGAALWLVDRSGRGILDYGPPDPFKGQPNARTYGQGPPGSWIGSTVATLTVFILLLPILWLHSLLGL